MPRTDIVMYRESDGSVPLLDWLDGVPDKVNKKCIALIEALAEHGYDLRRPMCDFLSDGIYELRASRGGVNYRILYGFAGRNIVLLSHGCTKKKKVRRRDIRQALLNLGKYKQDPEGHTHKE
jgi:hypothetical protein